MSTLSTLQIGLAITGGLVLAGLVAHNTWQSRRNMPRQAQPDDAGRPDAGPAFESGAPLTEPTLDGEPAMTDVPPPHSGLGPLLPAAERRPGLDALIDVITPIALDHPSSGDAALAALPPTRRAGSKPFAVEGLNEVTGEWEPPQPGQRYSAFQAGVQLANRMGAMNEIEFSEFVMKTQDFADALSGAPEFPDMLDEVARARELDQFAGAHDAQLSFNLRARSTAWSPGYVQQHAARLGFVPGALPGRMVLPGAVPGSPPMLVLAFDALAALAEDPAQSALRELTLSLDVPQVPREERPFARMAEAAHSLAQAMDGVMTDDDGQPLRPEVLDVIAADLEQLYDTLDARDLSAGSALARRLFS